MKKYLKILTIFICFIGIVVFLENLSFGYEWKEKISSMYVSSDAYDGKESVTSVKNMTGAIVSIVQIVATGIAIVMLIVVAMKYMIAAPGHRADIKKHAIVYIVGAIVLFATTGILQIIVNFTENFVE